MTLNQVRRLRREYATGRWSQRELAERHGAALWTVRRVLVGAIHPDPGYAYQRPRLTRPRGKLGPLRGEIKRLRDEGQSLSQIARLVGASRQAVHQRLHPTAI